MIISYLIKVFIKMKYRPDSYEISRIEYKEIPTYIEIEKQLNKLKDWENRECYEGSIYAEVTTIYKL